MSLSEDIRVVVQQYLFNKSNTIDRIDTPGKVSQKLRGSRRRARNIIVSGVFTVAFLVWLIPSLAPALGILLSFHSWPKGFGSTFALTVLRSFLCSTAVGFIFGCIAFGGLELLGFLTHLFDKLSFRLTVHCCSERLARKARKRFGQIAPKHVAFMACIYIGIVAIAGLLMVTYAALKIKPSLETWQTIATAVVFCLILCMVLAAARWVSASYMTIGSGISKRCLARYTVIEMLTGIMNIAAFFLCLIIITYLLCISFGCLKKPFFMWQFTPLSDFYEIDQEALYGGMPITSSGDRVNAAMDFTLRRAVPVITGSYIFVYGFALLRVLRPRLWDWCAPVIAALVAWAISERVPGWVPQHLYTPWRLVLAISAGIGMELLLRLVDIAFIRTTRKTKVGEP